MTARLRRGLGRFGRYLNPLYHLRQAREDLRASRHALRNYRFESVRHDREMLARTMRGKLFGTFFVAGIFNLAGVITGTAAQAATQNPWVGLFTTIVVASVVSTTAYQIVWAIANRDLYRRFFRSRWQRFLAIERDLLPIQLTGFKFALAFGLISVPLTSLLILVLEPISPYLVRVIPMGVVVATIDAVLVSGTFVRIMGDLFEFHSVRLANKYGVGGNPYR
ncbi:MAG: hypothetical protein SNJ74_03660 [Fimbriimonadaceae bacterium]